MLVDRRASKAPARAAGLHNNLRGDEEEWARSTQPFFPDKKFKLKMICYKNRGTRTRKKS